MSISPLSPLPLPTRAGWESLRRDITARLRSELQCRPPDPDRLAQLRQAVWQLDELLGAREVPRSELEQWAQRLRQRLSRERRRPNNDETVADLVQQLAALRHVLKRWPKEDA